MYISKQVTTVFERCLTAAGFNGTYAPSWLQSHTARHLLACYNRCRDLGFRPFLAVELEAPSYCVVLGFVAESEMKNIENARARTQSIVFSQALVYGWHSASRQICLHTVRTTGLSGYIALPKFPEMSGGMVSWFTQVFGDVALGWMCEALKLDQTDTFIGGSEWTDAVESCIDSMWVCVNPDQYEQARFQLNGDPRTWSWLDSVDWNRHHASEKDNNDESRT